MVTATVRDGVDPARVEREMDRVVGELLQAGADRGRAAARRAAAILADFARGAERLGGFGGRSDILAESMTFDGRPDGYLDRLERVATATPADVRADRRRRGSTRRTTR